MRKIEILINNGSYELYEATNSNLDFYLKHLEYLSRRTDEINTLIKKFPFLFNNEIFNKIHFQLEFDALLTISVLDLSLISRELFVSKRTWEQFYYSKQACLVIFETIECINEKTKKLNKNISELSSESKLTYNKIAIQLRKFKKDYHLSTDILNIRNKIAGHIDKDFKIYYANLKKLQEQDVGGLLKDFVAILSEFHRFSKDTMKEYVEIANQQKADSEAKMEAVLNKLTQIMLNNNKKNHV